MEKCWEYLGCKQTNCIMHGRMDNVKCWEEPDTLCNHPGLDLIQKVSDNKKIKKCKYCIYYIHAKNMMGTTFYSS